METAGFAETAGFPREFPFVRGIRPCYHASVPGRPGTMAIKARGISGSDPGAVPGGSTKTFRWRFTGPKQDRRTCKGVSFRPVGYRRDRSAKHNCQRQ